MKFSKLSNKHRKQEKSIKKSIKKSMKRLIEILIFFEESQNRCIFMRKVHERVNKACEFEQKG